MLHEEIIQQKIEIQKAKRPALIGLQLWIDIIVFSILVLLWILSYYVLTSGNFNLRQLSLSIADTSIILIGLSFALSGICYFWNFADHFIVYRKELGVIGFGYALIHTLWKILDRPFLTYFDQENIIMFMAGLIALIMYALMIMISTKSVIQKIGGKTWRTLLRVGYIAFMLSLLHLALVRYHGWIRFFEKGETVFPPFSLIVTVFGISVLILRVMVWISNMRNKPTPPPVTNTPPPTQPVTTPPTSTI